MPPPTELDLVVRIPTAHRCVAIRRTSDSIPENGLVAGSGVDYFGARRETKSWMAEVEDISDRSALGPYTSADFDSASDDGSQDYVKRSGKAFVGYLCEISAFKHDLGKGGQPLLLHRWRVLKRYSTLRQFSLALENELGKTMPVSFPPKCYSLVCPVDISTRRQHLQDYLQHLLSEPHVLSLLSVDSFLSYSDADLTNVIRASEGPTVNSVLNRSSRSSSRSAGAEEDTSVAGNTVGFSATPSEGESADMSALQEGYFDIRVSIDATAHEQARLAEEYERLKEEQSQEQGDASSSRELPPPRRERSARFRNSEKKRKKLAEMEQRVKQQFSEDQLSAMRQRFKAKVTRHDGLLTRDQLCDLCSWDQSDPQIQHYLKSFDIEEYDLVDFQTFASLMAVAVKRIRRRSIVSQKAQSHLKRTKSLDEVLAEGLPLRRASLPGTMPAPEDSSAAAGEADKNPEGTTRSSRSRRSSVTGVMYSDFKETSAPAEGDKETA
eukprot:scaffold4700_cov271-Pinguiococcus_pyrenoidosus.AAC.3